jgi:uncharacterized protein
LRLDTFVPGSGEDLQESLMNRNLSSDTPENLASHSTKDDSSLEPSRREFLAGIGGIAVVTALSASRAFAQAPESALNIARVAVPTSLTMASENKIAALNDGFTPATSLDRSHAHYAVWAERSTSSRSTWVQYDWTEPVNVNKVEIYWAVDRPRSGELPGSYVYRIAAPESCRILYWNGSDFVPVSQPQGLGVALDTFNVTTFEPVKTSRLRLEVFPQQGRPAGILEWKVFNYGPIPSLPPVVDAGVDRSVVSDGQTYLSGKVTWLEDSSRNRARWVKTAGPGDVVFADAASLVSTATFSQPGDYMVALEAAGSKGPAHTIGVHVEPAPPADRLNVVYTRKYSIDGQLWKDRAKVLIVNWIPHCVAMCERTDIPAGRGDGGIDNFIEAGKANRGEPHGKHKGFVFSNAWVHQTVESMCIALMVDPQGDPEVIKQQELMRTTLERWIPIILAAQMPDGYLQTAFTLDDRKNWPERWSPEHRGNHEGYVSGYFIESAINHYTLTDGKDLRLYNAAKKLADCWVANIGPGKKEWFDGHQEMEQALVRFGRFVNDQEGDHHGDAYISLAKFLLDSRRGGAEYDQSHLPPGQQYEAVGHAVRATYFYSGMADIAAETRDRDYQSAVISLWDNMVNKKYYLTGGIGSGETSEGFGPNYSLRNEAYCETCSSCGLVFFNYKLNLAYHDAKYADLYEQTMYNALLGGLALNGESYCYTNPLVNTERAKWHVCPCCVGNVARTLLMIPTWTYVKSNDGLYVNMFVGSRIHVGQVAGTNVEVVQKTEYPWHGTISITLNPEEAKTFSVYVRIPDRTTSKLYKESPRVRSVKRFAVNGQEQTPVLRKGYAVVTREWKAGDRIDLELPMDPQRVVAESHIKADQDMVALQYGPLIYNVEIADNNKIDRKLGDAPLRAEWRPELLGGVMVISGKWQDGAPMLAIPNFVRMNRVAPPREYPGDEEGDRIPGSKPSIDSKVWI